MELWELHCDHKTYNLGPFFKWDAIETLLKEQHV